MAFRTGKNSMTRLEALNVENIRQGLVTKHKLTARDLAELERLTALCNDYEHLQMRLDYNLLTHSDLPTDDLFLAYTDNQLAGCLLMDRYHSDVKEVTGMVHPDFRRQGIFHQLLAAARTECLSRGIRRLIFICETGSASGQNFVRAIRAGREFAEHRMVLRNFRPRLQYDDHLIFREALFHDLDRLSLILATQYDDNQAKARRHVLQAWERPEQTFYIATYGEKNVGCEEPVGTLRVEEIPTEIGIYGFVVRPEYRKRGHGRQILEEAIVTIRASSQKLIMLEVDTNNFNALNLYRSCGFAIDCTYEYYGLALE
jgi:ribosomal protein S18 acetylase RimI-like enzyme